jgi:glycosyltransferase involved in cell wall biosynthesis
VRILLVHNHYRKGNPGGEDLVFEQERQLLTQAGHEVVTYTRSNDEMDEGSLIDSLRVATGLHRSARSRAEIGALIAAHRPDIAHFHNTFPLISASGFEACKAARIPVVQSLHNYRPVCLAATHFRSGQVCEECVPGRPWPGFRHRCYRGSLPASALMAFSLYRNWQRSVLTETVNHLFVASEFARQRLIVAGVPAEQVTWKPNFVPAPVSAVQQNRRGVVFVGRLSEEKGFETALQAWQRLSPLELTVIGDGPLRGVFERRSRELGLSIRFVGMLSRSETIERVAEATALIFTSGCFEMGVPLTILEAWSVGTPVVTSRIGAMTDLIDAEQCLHFNPGDAGALARQVARLIGDDVLAARLGMNGASVYHRHHTSERALQLLLKTYQTVIERNQVSSV